MLSRVTCKHLRKCLAQAAEKLSNPIFHTEGCGAYYRSSRELHPPILSFYQAPVLHIVCLCALDHVQANLSIQSALADSACRPVKGWVWLTGSGRGARLPVTARLISTWLSSMEEMRAWRIGHVKVGKLKRKLLPKLNIQYTIWWI